MGATGRDLKVWLGNDNTVLELSQALHQAPHILHDTGTYHSPLFTDQETKAQVK